MLPPERTAVLNPSHIADGTMSSVLAVGTTCTNDSSLVAEIEVVSGRSTAYGFAHPVTTAIQASSAGEGDVANEVAKDFGHRHRKPSGMDVVVQTERPHHHTPLRGMCRHQKWTIEEPR